MRIRKYGTAVTAMNLYAGKNLRYKIPEGTTVDLYVYVGINPKDMYGIYFPKLKILQAFFDKECFRDIKPLEDLNIEDRLKKVEENFHEKIPDLLSEYNGVILFSVNPDHQKTPQDLPEGVELCTRCGKKVPAARFCLYCGAPLQDGLRIAEGF